MSRRTSDGHWLSQYGSATTHAWRKVVDDDGRNILYRPLGLVEYAFDSDGRYYEGRADMNCELQLSIRSRLSKAELRARIVLAWTLLRCQHVLIQAAAVGQEPYMQSSANATIPDRCFAIALPNNADEAIESGKSNIDFLEDHYDHVDPLDFWIHAQNSARAIDPSICLSRLFVFPLEHNTRGPNTLRFFILGSHQIQDGLSSYLWMRSFVHILNLTMVDLRQGISAAIEPTAFQARLPAPQESLYPLVSGSRAKQRWFWLLTRILRHVRTPHGAGFPNPLRRKEPLEAAVTLSPTYDAVLDYSRPPLLNSYPLLAKASPKATERLHKICRSAGISVGAGCFALAALIMMEFHERLDPKIPLHERKPFITGFPLNPRPFLSTPQEPDSLMLAFSDGIQLPFLSCTLPLEGRIKLLGRHAQRQLSIYQKKARPKADEEGLQYMGSRGAGRVLAIQYLSSFERSNAILPPERRRDGLGPQGAYPMRPNNTAQTCGVSSVGRRDAIIKRGMYDLEKDDGKDFVADFRETAASVRVRDGEFLVGVGGTEDGLFVAVSVDATAMDPQLVEEWRQRFLNILEEKEDTSETARL